LLRAVGLAVILSAVAVSSGLLGITTLKE